MNIWQRKGFPTTLVFVLALIVVSSVPGMLVAQFVSAAHYNYSGSALSCLLALGMLLRWKYIKICLWIYLMLFAVLTLAGLFIMPSPYSIFWGIIFVASVGLCLMLYRSKSIQEYLAG